MGAQRNPLVERLQEPEPLFKLEPHYTLAELAEALRFDPQTIGRYLRAGHLKGYKFGSDWRISQSAIDLFLSTYKAKRRGHKVVGTFAGHQKGKRGVSLPRIGYLDK